MKTVKIFVHLCLALALAFFAMSCSDKKSGDSSSGDTNSLTVTDKVTVVDAQLSGTASGVKPLKMGAFKVTSADLPADSDYNNDKTQVWVSERSVEAFNTINEILCSIAQSKYDEMLNLGDYTAQIDIKQCKSDNADAESAGQESQNQSSGSDMPEYELWTVNSSRANNSSPHIVKVWVHEKANEWEPPKLIYVKATITEGKSDTNPYGLFTMNFKASPVDPSGNVSPDAMFKGSLKTEKDASTGKILLKFIVKDTGMSADNSFEEASTLDKDPAGSTGAGTAYQKETHTENSVPYTKEHEFNLAFNSTHFLRMDADTNASVCLSRTAFDESAWRYGLYDSTTGARIYRNSGFPIKTTNNMYGWVGYWGLWLPEEAVINNGDTVYKHDYSDKTDTAYTVVKAGGKLKKHTRKDIFLGDIKNIPLDWYENNTQTNYRVIWNGSAFMKTASTSQDLKWVWQDLAPPVALDLSALDWTDLNFWSQSLGGQVRIKLEGCTYDNVTTHKYNCTGTAPNTTTPVVFYAEDMVYPSDAVPALLRCYDNCPDPSKFSTLTDADTANDNPFFNWGVETNYTFDSTAIVLKYNDTPIVLTGTITSEQFQWGMMSGPLFEATTANLDLLKCDWLNAQGGYDTCGWKAWSELPVFYTWETGPNNWNQFTAVEDAGGAIVKFEAPLQVQYIHSETGHKYDGVKFYLDYSGFGQLNGIPGICVNMDTGAPDDCSKGGSGVPIRWVPEFSIPAGSMVTASSTMYYAKPLEMEQRMKKDDAGCTGLTASSYTLPTLADWEDPSIGEEPVITDPPAVIGGVVQ